MPNAAWSYGDNARVLVVPVFNATAMCAIAALAATPFVLSAAAHADPAPVGDPRAECESPAFGGHWVDEVPPHAVCQYIVEGQFYYDSYDNGSYTGTLVYRDGSKVPTERPVIPELLTIPNGLPPLVAIAPPS
jgi:hypothetical protein